MGRDVERDTGREAGGEDTPRGKDTPPRTQAPLRSDAQRNRERILEVALAELTRSADTPLSVIAKKAGVGQGTLYRNFPAGRTSSWRSTGTRCARWPTARRGCWRPGSPTAPCVNGWTGSLCSR